MKSSSVDVLSGIEGIMGLKRFIILVWHEHFEHNGNIVSNMTQITALEYN